LSAGDFLRYKSELLKLQDIDILPFPRTELPGTKASDSIQLNWTFLRDAMPAILLSARKADSYSQFSSSSVPFGIADARLSLHDFGSRVKEGLENLKKDYSDFVEEVIMDLSRYESSSLERPNEQRFVAYVKDAMRPSFEVLIKTNPSVDDGAYHDRLYPYFSFLILKAQKYAQKRREAPDVKVDKNDYVDSYLCLHLDLQKPYILITKDNALRSDLSWTLNAIKVAHGFTPECTVEDPTRLPTLKRSA